MGDLTELQGVGEFFKDSHDFETHPLRIASVKGNIGHGEMSAGIFSVAKVRAGVRVRVRVWR